MWADNTGGLRDQTYYYHFDATGNVIALSDSTGNTAEIYRYDPFGRFAIYAPDGTTRTESICKNEYLFTSRRWDWETSLYYYRARIYNPKIGRFLQTDPIGYADGINWYTYCRNNPIMFVDPWGLCEDSVSLSWGWFGEEPLLDISDNKVMAGKDSYDGIGDLRMELHKPVPGKPGQKGWEYRYSPGHNVKDPAHYQLRKRGKNYARRVYPDGTQSKKKHGKGINKPIPQKVINALLDIPIIIIVVPKIIIEAAFPELTPRKPYHTIG